MRLIFYIFLAISTAVNRMDAAEVCEVAGQSLHFVGRSRAPGQRGAIPEDFRSGAERQGEYLFRRQ